MKRQAVLDDDGYDRGWAWVVLAAACVSNCVTLAPFMCASIINSFFLDSFQESTSYTAIPVALMIGMLNIFGIPASILDNQYGPCITLFIGTLLSSIGLALSAYATSIAMAIPTLGILCGGGLACNYLSALTVIPLYFRKYRTFAFNVLSAGSSASTFIFPPVISALMEYYSWRGTLLIITGFLLQGCVLALLFRSKERKHFIGKCQKQVIQEFENESQECQLSNFQKQEYRMPSKCIANKLPDMTQANGGPLTLMRCISLGSLHRQKGLHENLKNGSAVIYGSHPKVNGDNSNGYVQNNLISNGSARTLSESYHKTHDDQLNIPPFSCQKYSQNVHGLEVHSSWSVLAIDDDGHIHNFTLKGSAGSHNADHTCFAKVSKYYYLDIFMNKGFLCVLCACVFRACGKGTVLLYLTNILLLNGYKLSYVAQIYVVIGVSQLVSVPLVGFIANRLKYYNIHFWMISLVFSGLLALVTTVVLDNWILLCVVLASYGIADSYFDSMWGAVITDVLGVKRIGNGAGTAACFYGITVIIASLFTGWLADFTSSYIACWYFAGTAYFLSAIATLLCAYFIHKKRKERIVDI